MHAHKHARMRCVGGEVVPLCVEAFGTMRSEESEHELDWLLSLCLMWATDLKTGLCEECALAAHALYCMPRMRCSVVFTLNARLQHDAQRWDLILETWEASGLWGGDTHGERDCGEWIEGTEPR